MPRTPKPDQVAALLAAGNVWLAPMAGVTDQLFRAVCREHGCPLAVTEMVSATGLAYGSAKTRQLYAPGPGEERVAVQLFGSDPDELARAAAAVEADLGEKLALIDLNMGCPVPKVTRKGAGSALMRDPERAAAIVRAVDSAVSVPVSAKFRRGISLEDENCVDFARALEEAGASLLAVHGRTAGQLYRGRADWGCIAQVKQAVSVPVLGNGDLTDAVTATSQMARSGVDGALVGRGALGNPWIFAQIAEVQAGREPRIPGIAERVAQLREHCHRFAAWREESQASEKGPGRPRGRRRQPANHHEQLGPNLSAMRKHAMWYLSGLPGASRLRAQVNGCTSLEDFDALCDRALELAGVAGL